MVAKILDGRTIAAQHFERIKAEVSQLSNPPKLVAILVGEDPASRIYIKNKRQACEKTGILSNILELPKSTSEAELLNLIDQFNKDITVSGILVQLPLPSQINEQKVIESIDPKKDVDGFHPYNLGLLVQKHPFLRSCTPYGIMELIKTTNSDLVGKEAVIVGASIIVGRPMALELLMADCTVTICHKHTANLSEKISQADILVSAIGQPNLIKGEWIKPNAIVVDVGINRLPNGSITGDIEFDAAAERASYITPVPGGVGPMTVAMLMNNTLLAHKNR